jgi:hypothetical protein
LLPDVHTFYNTLAHTHAGVVVLGGVTIVRKNEIAASELRKMQSRVRVPARSNDAILLQGKRENDSKGSFLEKSIYRRERESVRQGAPLAVSPFCHCGSCFSHSANT